MKMPSRIEDEYIDILIEARETKDFSEFLLSELIEHEVGITVRPQMFRLGDKFKIEIESECCHNFTLTESISLDGGERIARFCRDYLRSFEQAKTLLSAMKSISR